MIAVEMKMKIKRVLLFTLLFPLVLDELPAVEMAAELWMDHGF